MSNTNFIRFPDESTATEELEINGFLTEDGTPILASHHHALDIIGTITRGGEYDPDTGEVIIPPETLPGWHINFIGTLPESWNEYIVNPENPVRVFAQ